jgi:transposase
MISVMPNTGLAIELQPAERTQLEQWESAHGTPQQVALRCRIILRAVAGQQNVAIAEGLGVSRPTVQLWRKRVCEQGIGEVWKIAPGRGRKAHYDQGQRDRIIKATLQSKPQGMTHWSCRLMAEAQGVSKNTVNRLWQLHNIKPHLSRTFKLSRDAKFLEKLTDVVGLYMNPPDKALVLCVDEKSQIQALDRTQPGLPLKKVRVIRRKSMNRSLFRGMLCPLSFAIALAGCAKSSNPSAVSDPAPTSSSASAKKAEASKPRPMIVPRDTRISVVLDQPVGSKFSATGETFTATVEAPVEIDGKVAIPKGARTTGMVKEAKAAGRFNGGAVLELVLTSVTLGEKDYEIQTSSPAVTTKGKGKRTAAMVGGGTGGGAAIGAVAGGGKGAAIGALIGAAAGTGGAGLTGNRDITLPAETALSFKLLQPLEIKAR